MIKKEDSEGKKKQRNGIVEKVVKIGMDEWRSKNACESGYTAGEYTKESKIQFQCQFNDLNQPQQEREKKREDQADPETADVDMVFSLSHFPYFRTEKKWFFSHQVTKAQRFTKINS